MITLCDLQRMAEDEDFSDWEIAVATIEISIRTKEDMDRVAAIVATNRPKAAKALLMACVKIRGKHPLKGSDHMDKYGVVTERKDVCPVCREPLDTSTNPPTCPTCGTEGIEKEAEDEDDQDA